jgi:hypothetical protein
MQDLEKTYGVPAELKRFVDAGFLVVVFEKPDERTVTFGIPGLAYTDENNVETYFALDWIHPDVNAQLCHYFRVKPGDLANFYLTRACRERGDEPIDVESLEDLIAWLSERQRRHRGR